MKRIAPELLAAVALFATKPIDPAYGADAQGILPPQFQLLRYDENYEYLRGAPWSPSLWDELKFIPVDGQSGEQLFLSLGGEARFQSVEKWDDQFGRVPGWQDSLQQRYLLHSEIVLPQHFRLFGQLISAWENGKRPAALPVDVDHLDAQQLFVEAWLPAEKPGDDYLRVGRQEILLGGHQLLKVREGPNVRLAFDGARLHVTDGSMAADAFASTVVHPKPGVFDDDWLDNGQEFSGINLGWRTPISGFHADAFWFDYRNRLVSYQRATGAEHRETLGARIDGHRGPWDFDYEATAQYGTLGDLGIRAWATALFTSHRWDAVPARPDFTLGFSYASGDRNHPGELNTFNCLFARGDYFGDTSLLTGSNTIDLSGKLDLAPLAGLHSATQWDLLWRSERTDGLYTAPLIFIVDGRGSNARFIGDQPTETITWTLNRFVTVQIIGSVLLAGDFIKAATPGNNTRGLTLRAQYKF